MSTECGKRKLRGLHQVFDWAATVATDTAALMAAKRRGERRISNSLDRGTDGSASLDSYEEIFQGSKRRFPDLFDPALRLDPGGIGRRPCRWSALAHGIHR